MSTIIDAKYIALISPKLLVFKRKGNAYNFRCPFCGDSQKNKHKARGYLFPKKDGYIFKCHNCDLGTSLYKVIDTIDPSLARVYKLESFKERGIGNEPLPFSIPDVRKEIVTKTVLDDMLVKIKDLPADHFAVQYAKGRKIPKERYDDLYFARDMKALEVLNPAYEGRLVSDARLVIPFRNANGKLTGVSGRALGTSTLRYVTMRIEDEALVYGLDRVDTTKTIYVVEGPIDSMFLPNAIAAGGTDFTRAVRSIPTDRVVLVFDNQPRNQQVVKKIESFVSGGYGVVIWPDHWKYKDINEAVIDGLSTEAIHSIINTATHTGLALKLAIRSWKKC
jgi:hypothetical protein